MIGAPILAAVRVLSSQTVVNGSIGRFFRKVLDVALPVDDPIREEPLSGFAE